MINLNPCIEGWNLDLMFYVGTAREYVEMAKGTEDKFIRDMWLDYAQRAIKAAEDQIKKFERG